MPRIYAQLFFVCLLVLSQTALVSHDIKHLGSGHNELCAVYVSQDHSTHSVSNSVPPISYLSPENFQADVVDVFSTLLFTAFASRAPPITAFLS